MPIPIQSVGVVACVALVAGLAGAWWWERRARRRAEVRLRSADDRLRALFDESPLSICVFDPNDRDVPYRIVECNQHACDLHGWTREELLGRGMEVLTPINLSYESAQAFMAKLRTGPCRGENPHRRKDGSVFFIEYIARRVVIDDREYMIGVDRDLSEKRACRASEEQLRRTAEFNQLVLRASTDGVWDWRIDEGVIMYSDRCREMLGYTAEELPDDNLTWRGLIHPADELTRADLLRRHWEENAPYLFQYRARHKDGSWRWIISRGITLFDADHRPVRMVGSRTDITELKQIDAELVQSRKLRAVGEMVGGIAHEFNNLLTPMLLHAEMMAMEDQGRDSGQASHIGPICIGIDRARELIQRILAFGRRPVEACEFLSLEEVVRENIDFLAQTIDRRIQIAIQPSAPAVVWANRSDLNQLVVNLTLNARDTLLEKAGAMSADWAPQIWITLEGVNRVSGARDKADRPAAAQAWHRLTVRDNGLGMSDHVRERVFEPFFTTKEAGRGTGLGLATSWNVTTTMGGWIEVESREGEGTAFHVFLPAATVPETHVASPGAADPLSTSTVGPLVSPSPVRLRVLLVEDSEIVAYATQRMIESFGHEVDLATDGQAAWAKLSRRSGHHDVVFTDLNLPGLSGVELVRRLREARHPGRVVVYSGYFSTADEAELTALRVDHLLQKPFFRAQLVPMLG